MTLFRVLITSLQNCARWRRPIKQQSKANEMSLNNTLIAKSGNSLLSIFGFKETWLLTPFRQKSASVLVVGWLQYDSSFLWPVSCKTSHKSANCTTVKIWRSGYLIWSETSKNYEFLEKFKSVVPFSRQRFILGLLRITKENKYKIYREK